MNSSNFAFSTNLGSTGGSIIGAPSTRHLAVPSCMHLRFFYPHSPIVVVAPVLVHPWWTLSFSSTSCPHCPRKVKRHVVMIIVVGKIIVISVSRTLTPLVIKTISKWISITIPNSWTSAIIVLGATARARPASPAGGFSPLLLSTMSVSSTPVKRPAVTETWIAILCGMMNTSVVSSPWRSKNASSWMSVVFAF